MKARYQKTLLTQAVLASTLFISHIAYADVVIAPNSAPRITSVNGDVQIAATGSIAGTPDQDGVLINTIGGKLIVDPNNTQPAAIKTSGAAVIIAAVGVLNPNASIQNGANSVIEGASTKAGSDAIGINASNTTILNAGTIKNTGVGSDAGIEILGGTNTNITNSTGGVISTVAGVTGETIRLNAGASALSLKSAGTISQAAVAKNTISLLDTFTEITNQSGGLITQTGGGAATVIGILVVEPVCSIIMRAQRFLQPSR